MKQNILPTLGYVITLSLVFCVYLMGRKHIALQKARQYEGTVIGYESRPGNKGTTYSLKVEYQDSESQRHTFIARGSSNPPARAVGAKVTVFQHATPGVTPDILVFEDLYLGYWIWLCLGVCVAGCLVSPFVLKWLYLR